MNPTPEDREFLRFIAICIVSLSLVAIGIVCLQHHAAIFTFTFTLHCP